MSRDSDTLIKKIDKTKLPAHIAIIMDGNGRWAKRRHLPRLWGHKEGSKTVRKIVEASGEVGIQFLTLFAFSTENWSRPKTEVSGLMKILKQTLKNEQPKLDKQNVQLDTIGNISKLPSDVQDQLSKTKKYLSKNTGLKLILALNYGARQDVVNSVNIAIKNGATRLTEKMITDNLYTSHIPDPDLLIRTSGEQRVSNFLLWQIAYSELHITPTLWPDFKKRHFCEAILEFQSRERRYGGVS